MSQRLVTGSVWLVRHPPVSGWDGKCYGRSDAQVEESVLQVACSGLLSGLVDLSAPVLLHASPLSRCAGLADALHVARPDVFSVPTLDERLLELDFGTWEGVAWDDISRDEIDAWAANPWDYRPGSGESARQLLQRWRQFKAGCLGGLDGAPNVRTGRPTLVLTHAGVIRMALHDAGVLSEQSLWMHAVPHAVPITLHP